MIKSTVSKVQKRSAEGRLLLLAEVAKLLPSLPDDTEPFASDDDDKEAERNQAFIDEDTDCFVSYDDNEEAERNEAACIDEDDEMKMSSRIQNDYTCYFYG